MTAPVEARQRPRVVIVGAGFAGMWAARALARAPVEITVIDRRNYHLFQPLLYQVATAALSPGDIAWPIRRMLRRQRDTRVLLGEITGVDMQRRAVSLGDQSIPYDYLILATGVRHDYFGHDDWEASAPGLKELDDATRIRRRILLAFERAECGSDPSAQRRLLTFVIVGGGPTGVELAGAIAELARRALAADFRHIDPKSARILLCEAGERVLPAFPEALSRYAGRALARLGVEVKLKSPVTDCGPWGVTVGTERVEAATVLWAAGVAASPVARWLGIEADRLGRVPVAPDLSVPGLPEVFVAGDVALVSDATGRPLPGVAPAAKQAGAYVARVIAARVAGRPAPPPFRYRDFGNLATIGRRAAVIDFGWLRIKGGIAWWIWGIAHIYFLIGMRNRLIVSLQWLWAYLTFDRGARLITGGERED
ncbi:MAG: NAD(P)/FAD-dependent oxidoreductase [Gammaproteobacteria bacterium]